MILEKYITFLILLFKVIKYLNIIKKRLALGILIKRLQRTMQSAEAIFFFLFFFFLLKRNAFLLK